MEVATILTPSRTFIGLEGASKKRVLENAAAHIAEQAPEYSAGELFDQLMNRERLGTTAVGEGIAIPHCRAKHCPDSLGALFRLAEPVDFDAPDNIPVDIMFVLLVSEDATEEHLSLLSQIAQRFANSELRNKLRAAANPQQFFQTFIE